MPARAHLLISLTIVFTASLLGGDLLGDHDISTPDRLTIHGATGEMEATIVEAVERFEAAGLGLPVLSFHVHDSRATCNGAPGLYSKGGDQHRIDLCDPSEALVIHELAHAWEFHHVSDATREAFMELTGARVWSSHEVPHPARGVEQFAHAIEWGLKDEAIQPMSMSHYAPDLRRFELATGLVSPRLQPDPPTEAAVRG